jgi:4-hydroxy-tetrahydrodipicolinate synthase
MANSLNLAGAFTALVTPFLPGGEQIDFPAFEAFVAKQIEQGISGLVPCGTTGESPTITDSEQLALVKASVKVAKGRVPVIAGTGSFSTKKTIEASVKCLEAGANGVMVVMPYYSKPTQEGLFQHIVAVAKATAAPIVLYNIPGRTQSDLLPDTLARVLDATPHVVAMKEATGNVLRCQELVRRFGSRLAVFSGDDSLALGMMALGAVGVISVTSNLLPGPVSHVIRLAAAGQWEQARAAHFKLLPVHEAMFLESNPGPVKAAMAKEGMIQPDVRLPLVQPFPATVDKVLQIIQEFTK